LGVTPFEFCRDLRRQKTRVAGPLLALFASSYIRLAAVSVKHRLVTDRQTHTHDDDGMYRALI